MFVEWRTPFSDDEASLSWVHVLSPLVVIDNAQERPPLGPTLREAYRYAQKPLALSRNRLPNTAYLNIGPTAEPICGHNLFRVTRQGHDHMVGTTATSPNATDGNSGFRGRQGYVPHATSNSPVMTVQIHRDNHSHRTFMHTCLASGYVTVQKSSVAITCPDSLQFSRTCSPAVLQWLYPSDCP
jgi:hypothetical protein